MTCPAVIAPRPLPRSRSDFRGSYHGLNLVNIRSTSFGPGFQFSELWSRSAKQLQWRCLQGRHTSLALVAEEPTGVCSSCNGKGWLVCDFCEGQKVNVQAKNSRIYRRCPCCRTAGVVICPTCKVFRCVSLPDERDAGITLSSG